MYALCQFMETLHQYLDFCYIAKAYCLEIRQEFDLNSMKANRDVLYGLMEKLQRTL